VPRVKPSAPAGPSVGTSPTPKSKSETAISGRAYAQRGNAMFIIKCKDLVETAPEGFPAWALTNRWERFVVKYPTLDEAISAVIRQVERPKTRPVPQRAYKVYEEDGRKLKLMWTLEPR